MSRLTGVVRRCIYTRWFYGFLSLVCLLSVAAEIQDILDPGENFAVDLISLVSSALAAVLAAVVFVDLQVRRGKP